jgi:hypothetical protein
MSLLLVLACSRRKHPTTAPLPAWHRYDGVMFRVCKRFDAERRLPSALHVRILSAEFGLLPPQRIIPWYDRRIDPRRAAELCASVTVELNALIVTESVSEIYLALSRTYRSVIGALPASVRVHGEPAPIGKMQADLRRWLGRSAPEGEATQFALDLRVGRPGR